MNLTKGELYCRRGNISFSPEVKRSLLPNLDILGSPIGDNLHCSKFIAGRCTASRKLLSGGVADVAALTQLRCLTCVVASAEWST